MIHAYNGSTADALWRLAWKDVLGATTARKNINKGDSSEVLHVAFGLSDPRQRLVFSRVPGVNPAFAIAEVVWILRGRRDSGFLKPWNSALFSFTGIEDELHGAYGYRLRNHLEFDQLVRAASALQNDPNQRQVVLQIWDAKVDAPQVDGKPRSEDIPCNVFALLKVVDGRLDWLQVMRSNDLVLGLPYNIFQWTTIQEVVAGWLGVDLGSYNHISDSLHVYDRDRAKYQVAESNGHCDNPDDLRLPLQESEKVFRILEKAIEDLAQCTAPTEVNMLVNGVQVPDVYLNWLQVMAAERLRRIKQCQLSDEMVKKIKNPALKKSFEVWSSRFRADQ